MKLLMAWIAAPLLITLSSYCEAENSVTLDLVTQSLTDRLGHKLGDHESSIAYEIAEIITSKSIITPITTQESEIGLTYLFDANISEHIRNIDASDTDEIYELIPRKGTRE